jgi:hypothetical protein
MAVHVTIETPSKAEAELLAALFEPAARAESWRGYGVIRLALRNDHETTSVIETIADGVHRHDLPWTRVRFDDEEHIFGTKRRDTRPERPAKPPPADAQTRPRGVIDRLADSTFAEWLGADSDSAT